MPTPEQSQVEKQKTVDSGTKEVASLMQLSDNGDYKTALQRMYDQVQKEGKTVVAAAENKITTFFKNVV